MIFIPLKENLKVQIEDLLSILPIVVQAGIKEDIF